MFDRLAPLAPLPVVNLDAPRAPEGGLLFGAPALCEKMFSNGGKCLDHYRALKSEEPGIPVGCPYGFASLHLVVEGLDLALTSFVPAPRLGTKSEKTRAKEYPETKTSAASLENAISAVSSIVDGLRSAELATIRSYSVGLHEIRKLNKTVKQTAERLCRQENREDPTRADPSLVRIWKSSEMMSKQFDMIEVLANEDLTKLPPNNRGSLYPIVDKCVRIFAPLNQPDRIRLESLRGFEPVVVISDVTFSIIPTVLIENALRYGLSGTTVHVRISDVGSGRCRLSVTNEASSEHQIDASVFGRGVRGATNKEGSGNGLFLAQLVANQHNTEIKLRATPAAQGSVHHEFSVDFETVSGKRRRS